MEYCSLGSLNDIMVMTGKTLNEVQIATVCKAMLEALGFMQLQSKIHRDIKPHNVLINKYGSAKLCTSNSPRQRANILCLSWWPSCPCVLPSIPLFLISDIGIDAFHSGDFGISSDLEAGALRKTVIGTPYYLAPEVLKDSGYDFKADIWAVGISAIEMAEKDPPYADLHPMRVLFVLANNPSPKLTHEEHWSPEFNSFVKSCLELNPEKRPFARDLLTHAFLRKANPAKLEPLLQSAEDAIDKHGGIEKALEAMKPKPEEEGETEQDAVDKDLDDDMMAGSGALLTLDSPGSTAGTSLAIGSSDDEGTDSFFDDFTSDEEDEEEIDIDDMLADLGDDDSSAKAASKKNAAASSSAPSSVVASRGSTSASSHPKLSTTSVTAVTPAVPSIGLGINVQLDIAGIVDARKDHTSNPTTPHKSSRTPRTRREEAAKLKIQMAANGQIFGAPAPVMTARGVTAPATPASDAIPSKEPAMSASGVSVEIDWAGLEQDAKEEAEQEAKKKREKEAAKADAEQAAAEVSAATPQAKAAATIDWTKQMQTVQDEIKAARGNERKPLRLPPGTTTSTGIATSSDSIISPTPRSQSSGSYDDLLAELDILRSGTPDKDGRPISLSRLIARAFDREFPSSKPSNIRGEWLGRTIPSANGAAPHPFRNNPQYVLTIAEPTQVLVTVKQLKSTKTSVGDEFSTASKPASGDSEIASNSPPRPISVHIFRVRNISHAFTELPAYGAVIESELSRDREAGNAGLLEESDDVKYVIVPVVHDLARGEKVEFELEVKCANKNAHAQLANVPTLESKWIRGAWTDRTAGGSATYPSWRQNPQFLLRVHKQSDVHLYLTQSMTSSTIEHLGWYIVRSDDSRHVMRLAQTRLMNNDLKFRKRMEISSGRLQLTPGSYIIIPCTYEPGKLGNFTLTALSAQAMNLDFDLVEAPYSRAFNGKWALESAGGCLNHPTWIKNPKFSIVVPRATQLTFVLGIPPNSHASTTSSGLTTPRSARGQAPSGLTSSTQLSIPSLATAPEDPFIGFYLFKGTKINAARLSRKDLVGRTKHFTDAREVVEGIRLEAGSYILVPCTYLPNVFSPFNLQVHADSDLEHVAPIEEASISLDGDWKAPNVTAGGNFSHPTWRLNPQYVITTKSETPVVVTLEQATKPNSEDLPFISVAVIRPSAATVHASISPTGSESSAPSENTPVKIGKKLFHIRPADVVHLSHFSNIIRQNSIPILVSPQSPLILLPMTMVPNTETSFKIAVNSKDVSLERLSDELFVKIVPGEWSVQTNTVGGCLNNRDTWLNNPKYRFATKKAGMLRFVLQQSSSSGIEHSSSLGALQAAAAPSAPSTAAASAPLAPGGFYIFRCPNPQVPSFTRQDFVGKSEFSSNKEVRAQFEFEVGVYCIVLTKFEPLKEGKFALHLFAPHAEFAIGSMK